MEDRSIKEAKDLVKSSVKASAMQLGLPVPIVHWQTQSFRGTTVHTAFIFIGEKHKRVSFLAQELSALVETKQTAAINNRIHDALVK